MYGGIASKELVTKMANSDFLSFLGAGGISIENIQKAIDYIKKNAPTKVFGVNVLYNHLISEKEMDIVDLLLKNNINYLEAAGFKCATLPLVKYRLSGVRRINNEILIPNKVFLKASRISVVEEFVSPISDSFIDALIADNTITKEQAILAKKIPLADAVIIEADSAGHTDSRSALAIFPAIKKICEKLYNQYSYDNRINIGLAGGLGTPESIAAAFVLGADFIMTGSINQCTVESGAPDIVKDLLSQCDIEDTEICPTGDMFATEAKIQVLKKGTLFPFRAKKLHYYNLLYNSIEDFPDALVKDLEKNYYGESIPEILSSMQKKVPFDKFEELANNPKKKMEALFILYFYQSVKNAYNGNINDKINFQIHCGPAMGAFNFYIKDSPFEIWENRHVDQIAIKLLMDTCQVLKNYFI
jgi:trans-AT polyketide synthase/acyltransferase/oxidoreductase domain-containing protein